MKAQSNIIKKTYFSTGISFHNRGTPSTWKELQKRYQNFSQGMAGIVNRHLFPPDYDHSARTCGPDATYRKYLLLQNYILSMDVKSVRQIFLQMRTFKDNLTEDTLLVKKGITTGEFAVFKTFADQHLRRE